MKLVARAEYILHHFNKEQHTGIVNKVINAVGLFFRAENVFFLENGQVLGNITLAGADFIDDLLHANRILA